MGRLGWRRDGGGDGDVPVVKLAEGGVNCGGVEVIGGDEKSGVAGGRVGGLVGGSGGLMGCICGTCGYIGGGGGKWSRGSYCLFFSLFSFLSSTFSCSFNLQIFVASSLDVLSCQQTAYLICSALVFS